MQHPHFYLIEGDVCDALGVREIINRIMPDEIYNLAAQSHVATSFSISTYTTNVNAIGVINILNAIKNIYTKKIKFYQASTSELYGKVREIPQDENTPFYPRSPYGISKLCAYWFTVNYREAYGVFACNGILFNHESPYRGSEFVTKKIVENVVEIKNKLQKNFKVGNLDAKRDWGYAKDYVKAMWMMLQQNEPDDYVIASGETHSVREFIEYAFKYVGINIVWKNQGVEEIGINKDTGEILVMVDRNLFRPAEVDLLLGNPNKAKSKLGWSSNVDFKELVEIMMKEELNR